MSVYFIDAVGPYIVLVGVLVSGGMMLAGFVADWRRADEVGPGPLDGRPQIPS